MKQRHIPAQVHDREAAREVVERDSLRPSMEPADKAEKRKADRPRERGEGEQESEDGVAPPSPIQIATEAGVAGDFELPDPQELRKIESDTQSRLKAILEVAGVTGLSQIDAQTFQDPEILRKLTNRCVSLDPFRVSRDYHVVGSPWRLSP